MPYVVVQVQNGKQDADTEPNQVTIVLHIGIVDDGFANQGHAHVCNIIEALRQDLLAKRTLRGKYTITGPFEWAVNDEDVWPVFIGAIETHWYVPTILPDAPNL
jgi:hypothetical protein